MDHLGQLGVDCERYASILNLPTAVIDHVAGSKSSLPQPAPPGTTERTHLLTADAVVHADTSKLESPPPQSKYKTLCNEALIFAKAVVPVLGNHILEQSMILAPIVSAGGLSTDDLAGIALGSLTANVTAFTIIQGFTGALDSVLPTAWTSDDPTLVGLWTQRMIVLVALLFIPIRIVWAQAEPILVLLCQDPANAKLAATYLQWLSYGLPAYAFNCIIKKYFEAQGLIVITTQISTFVAPINGVINWLLVSGPEPFNMGFIGAPIATAISFNLVAFLSVLALVFKAPRTAWHPVCFRSFTGLGLLIRLGMGGMKLPTPVIQKENASPV